LLAWAAAHERSLGAALFTFGFLTDIFTFGFLPVGVVNFFFLSYLALAALCTFGTHFVSIFSERDAWWRKLLSVLFPLGAQYAIGGLLSGFVVFYAKSSVVAVSWPFLHLLLAVYGGNEYFRKHREKLTFQTVLFFFALYAYCIFALPLLLHGLGPWVFLGSTLLAAFLFGLFLLLLKLANSPRYKESRPRIIGFSLGIIALVNGAYFSGVIPPIPLVLSHAEIYHTLAKTDAGYAVATDKEKPWWNPFPREVPHAPGTPLYVFSAIKAPVAFATTVTHEWERHVPGKGWVRQSRVSFPITGGREGGYRGYSLVNDPSAGDWRVTISAGNQVIGRVMFSVKEASSVTPAFAETL
jgi:hypothetical protein